MVFCSGINCWFWGHDMLAIIMSWQGPNLVKHEAPNDPANLEPGEMSQC